MANHASSTPAPSRPRMPSPGAFARRGFLSGLAALPLLCGGVPSVAVALAAEPDPIFAAIEKHRVAQATFVAAINTGFRLLDIPGEIEAAVSRATDAENEARYDMHEVVPTTIPGLLAYVEYWTSYLSIDDWTFEEFGWEAIPTIAEALANLFPSRTQRACTVESGKGAHHA